MFNVNLKYVNNFFQTNIRSARLRYSILALKQNFQRKNHPCESHEI